MLYHGIEVPSWFNLKPPYHFKPEEKITRTIKEHSFNDDGRVTVSLQKILDFIGDHPKENVTISGFGEGRECDTGVIEVECFEWIDNPDYKSKMVEYLQNMSLWAECKKSVDEAIDKGVDRWEGVPVNERPLLGNMDFWIKPSVMNTLLSEAVNNVEEFTKLSTLNDYKGNN